MKTLIAALAFSLISFGAFSQQTQKSNTIKKHTPKAVATYKCPVCGYASHKAGDCPKDKIALVKVGDYYCPDCYMSSSKPGKCEMCGVQMKQMK